MVNCATIGRTADKPANKMAKKTETKKVVLCGATNWYKNLMTLLLLDFDDMDVDAC